MSLELTTPEQEEVNRLAKSETDLPEYYDAGVRRTLRISRDFETFLILAPTDLKTSAIEWITKVVELNQIDKVRDQLRDMVLAQEVKNAGLKLKAYLEKIGEFDKFRSTFRTDSRFQAVPEVVKFINDLQSVMDEQILGQQRAFFDETLGKISQSSLDTLRVTDDDLEQIQSWRPVLSAYMVGG